VTSSEDYYPTVAINALMRVLRDPAMASQHQNVSGGGLAGWLAQGGAGGLARADAVARAAGRWQPAPGLGAWAAPPSGSAGPHPTTTIAHTHTTATTTTATTTTATTTAAATTTTTNPTNPTNPRRWSPR
jgi:hypothetical protein